MPGLTAAVSAKQPTLDACSMRNVTTLAANIFWMLDCSEFLKSDAACTYNTLQNPRFWAYETLPVDSMKSSCHQAFHIQNDWNGFMSTFQAQAGHERLQSFAMSTSQCGSFLLWQNLTSLSLRLLRRHPSKLSLVSESLVREPRPKPCWKNCALQLVKIWEETSRWFRIVSILEVLNVYAKTSSIFKTPPPHVQMQGPHGSSKTSSGLIQAADVLPAGHHYSDIYLDRVLKFL